MLFIMRLSKGDCIIAAAQDECRARDLAGGLLAQDGEAVVSVRKLPRYCVRMSPTEQGSLDVHCWDDASLDNILDQEYPALSDAFRTANSLPLLPAAKTAGPPLSQLKQAFEENTEMIRRGLRLEQNRFSSATPIPARKTARK